MKGIKNRGVQIHKVKTKYSRKLKYKVNHVRNETENKKQTNRAGKAHR